LFIYQIYALGARLFPISINGDPDPCHIEISGFCLNLQNDLMESHVHDIESGVKMTEHSYSALASESLIPSGLRGKGLKEAELAALQQKFGKNEYSAESKHSILHTAWDILSEPMFLILLMACILYFILGESGQGLLMLASLAFVATISFVQEVRSSHALDALRRYTQPTVSVVRDDQVQSIQSEDLLPGDIFLLAEGDLVPADAVILLANDLSVNESILTGEAVPIEKNGLGGDERLFQGTTINSGKCYARTTETGNRTQLGRIGKSLLEIPTSKTALQKQIARFVRVMASMGIVIFFLLWLLNFLHTGRLMESLLLGLTFAMAIIPEEIPVAFSSFMALGAYRMAKLGIITRQPLTIENLGAVSVICLDKTGTITENRMTVEWIYNTGEHRLEQVSTNLSQLGKEVLLYGKLASENAPFDATEKAIADAFDRQCAGGKASAGYFPDMVHEYPLGGHPPMMTHVYKAVGGDPESEASLVAGKGAPERIFAVCHVHPVESEKTRAVIDDLASRGYRVLGVCSALYAGKGYPDVQDSFEWEFKGLIGLYDPPKPGVAREFAYWRQAGIGIKLVTGDYPETSRNIAEQVGLEHERKAVTGNQIIDASPAELEPLAERYTIFARMFPDAKLKLVEALKKKGEIVAMMGDGVNDGPALRSAHIGVAMGGRGTEIARQAADLILTDDDMGKVTEAIRQGRKIYYNLKKAIRYIISIHVPIMVVASLPLLFNWKYPNIFTPVHVIFLELIMGPTCSVFFENEPVEAGLMEKPPRTRTGGIFTARELSASLLQGAIIGVGILGLYNYFMTSGYSLEYVRTVVFLTLIAGNVFLAFTNRSFEHTLRITLRYKNNLVKFMVGISVLFLGLLMFVPFVRGLFGLTSLNPAHYGICLAMSLIVTLWFEIYKTFK
jgi:Ca2+-transporting ATPase